MRFALLTGEHSTEFIVIGGLNPDFLAPNAPHPHQGTTDVDLLFELGFIYDRDELDFSWLDRALLDGGFKAIASKAGWQWQGELGDSRVRLDLLCDVSDSQGQAIHLPGATEASAQNLRGPAAAMNDPIYRELDVSASIMREIPNAPEKIRLRFASLGGYIAAKSAAFFSRDEEKDSYDLAFVVMYGDGGPRAAAAAVASTHVPPNHEPILPTVKSAMTEISKPDSPWIDTVVRQLIAAGDESEREQLRADVIISAQQFLGALPDE